MRCAILSHVLPPSPSGQAVVLFRILSNLKPEDYYLISSDSYVDVNQQTNNYHYLSTRHYILPKESQLYVSSIFGFRQLGRLVNIVFSIITRAKNLLNILKNDRATVLVACTGNLVDIPAGWLASQFARISFYIYVFDDYVYQWTGGYRILASLISLLIIKRSSGIIGPNEFICKEYSRRYGVESTMIRNPYGVDENAYQAPTRWPTESNTINIIYSGAVYEANSDCFRNLMKAIEILAPQQIKVHLFTSQNQKDLEAFGIDNDKMCVHPHVPYSQIIEQQRKADILFLPLAFNSSFPEIIRTSAPGKMGEYLVSGRPVLVHVPRESFVAYYINHYKCGLVIDENDPEDLASGINRIIHNFNLRQMIIGNAKHQAELDFNPETARRKFIKLIYNASTRSGR